jgi:hypothetical protein
MLSRGRKDLNVTKKTLQKLENNVYPKNKHQDQIYLLESSQSLSHSYSIQQLKFGEELWSIHWVTSSNPLKVTLRLSS